MSVLATRLGLERVGAMMMWIATLVLPVMPLRVLADECDRLPPPSVVIKRLETPVTLDQTYSVAALRAIGPALSRPNERVLGLTRAISRVTVETRIASYADRSGRWECASPALTVSYGYSPLTVYVARELAAGSCAYNEVYQHELRHVQTYQARLRQIEPEITEALQRRFVTGAVWRGPKGQTQQMLQRELDERWLPFIKRTIEKVDSEQALIDTPEEYARVAKSCHGEIGRLLH